MIDLFLKFTDQAKALSVMQSFTYTDEEGTIHLAQGSHQHALWEVGELPGREGWHVNLRVLDPEMDLSALEPYRVYPATPDCVWA
jgi:hypothetical protein